MLWFGLLLSCTLWKSAFESAPPKPSILFLVSDTTRADAFQKADTPSLDQLANTANGQAVPFAIAPSSWTSPSVLSMFTGQTVREHGWDYPIAQEMMRYNMEYPAISDDTQTLAEVLKEADYATHGFFANRFLIRDLGFSRGFDQWEFMNDSELSERTLRAFETIGDESSHFFYVHFFGPHQPLRPSEKRILKYKVDESQLNDGGIGFRQIKKMNATTETYKSMYSAVIEDTDDRMGLIIKAFLEKFPDGRIVMTSDHGEMIGEHGELGHKDGLYQELIHVPLVVFGDEDQQIGTLFSLTSIADWITDSIGVEAQWRAQWEPFAKSATEPPITVSQRDGDVTLIRSDKTKLVMDYPMTVQNGNFFRGKPSVYVFNLSKDPKELRPIENEEIINEVSVQLEAWQDAREPGVADGFTEQTNRAFIKDLRKLGYVSDGK